MTTEELRQYLKADAADDALLAAAWTRAIAMIEKEVDWYFGESRATTEILTGTTSYTRPKVVLFLRQPPLSITGVSERYGDSDWTAVSSSLYEVEGRKLIHRSFWPFGFRNVRVQYQEGFTEIPQDVQALALAIVQAAWQGRGGNDTSGTGGGVLGPKVSESIGDYSYTRAVLSQSSGVALVQGAGIASLWETVVNNWRRGRI